MKPVPPYIRKPAEVFPVGSFIKEEMEARGWSDQDVTNMIADPTKKLAFGLLLFRPIKGLTIGNEMARELARIFGTSKKYWLNLDAAWQKYVA